MQKLYPLKLEESFHETIWGGQRLGLYGLKRLPTPNVAIGESWETEIQNVVLNGPYQGKTLGNLVDELGAELLGQQAIAIFGKRFPLLAKFIDATAKLSVQVHPDDRYATAHEDGKLGKAEFWYILAAEPGATIIHGFKFPTSSEEVCKAIESVSLENLLKEVPVAAGDVIFVPAGTVHAIGGGVMLFELQEYSDLTYRMYDYGRLTTAGVPRELDVKKSLEVSHYCVSPRVKVQPVLLAEEEGYEDRCLIACQYFVTREITIKQRNSLYGYVKGTTGGSCIILTALNGEVQVSYGEALASTEKLIRGQTMVLPAGLGDYCLEGEGILMFSYVPKQEDESWKAWENKNSDEVTGEKPR
ncbi:MAG TPA: type I phosphomannose isomerase catalytic subunit [Ktedonobacteraceae bacterium]|nr:type I phosphomannose isomerase catalytic subunit [Ktedonobacteraceae bacterium]